MLFLHPETKEWDNFNLKGNTEQQLKVSKENITLKLDFTTLKMPQANNNLHANMPFCHPNVLLSKESKLVEAKEKGLKEGHALLLSPLLQSM